MLWQMPNKSWVSTPKGKLHCLKFDLMLSILSQMFFSAQTLVFGTGQMIKNCKLIKADNTYEESYITSDLQ